MHFVLSCYLQCTLWGGEMQQTLSQEGGCCPWAKQPHPSPRLCHRGWVTALGQTPVKKTPCQGQPEALGRHQRWAESWRCAKDWQPQQKACPALLHLAPCEADCHLLCSGSWSQGVLVILLPLDTEIPSTCATR